MNNNKSFDVRDLGYIAVFAALIAVLAFFAIPVGVLGVPIVLQNTAVILAGMVLGPKRGTLAVLLWLLVGLVLPVMSGKTLLAALAGPTVGYIVGYVVAAAVAGWIAYAAPRKKGPLTLYLAIAGIIGILVEYSLGIIGLVLRAGQTWSAATVSQIVFIPTDLLEIVFMVAIAVAVHLAFPDLRPKKAVTPPAPSSTPDAGQ